MARIVTIPAPRFPLDRKYWYFADEAALHAKLDELNPDFVEACDAAGITFIGPKAETMRALRQVVASLDVRRAQVLVEAVIAEVSVEQSAQLGVQWLVDGSGQAGVVGIVNFNNLLPTLAQAAIDRTVPAQLPAGAQLGIGARAGAAQVHLFDRASGTRIGP